MSCSERGCDDSGEGAENHDWHAGLTDGRGTIRACRWVGTGGADRGCGYCGCTDGRCWRNDKPESMSDEAYSPTMYMLT